MNEIKPCGCIWDSAGPDNAVRVRVCPVHREYGEHVWKDPDQKQWIPTI